MCDTCTTLPIMTGHFGNSSFRNAKFSIGVIRLFEFTALLEAFRKSNGYTAELIFLNITLIISITINL